MGQLCLKILYFKYESLISPVSRHTPFIWSLRVELNWGDSKHWQRIIQTPGGIVYTFQITTFGLIYEFSFLKGLSQSSFVSLGLVDAVAFSGMCSRWISVQDLGRVFLLLSGIWDLHWKSPLGRTGNANHWSNVEKAMWLQQTRQRLGRSTW